MGAERPLGGDGGFRFPRTNSMTYNRSVVAEKKRGRREMVSRRSTRLLTSEVRTKTTGRSLRGKKTHHVPVRDQGRPIERYRRTGSTGKGVPQSRHQCLPPERPRRPRDRQRRAEVVPVPSGRDAAVRPPVTADPLLVVRDRRRRIGVPVDQRYRHDAGCATTLVSHPGVVMQ